MAWFLIAQGLWLQLVGLYADFGKPRTWHHLAGVAIGTVELIAGVALHQMG